MTARTVDSPSSMLLAQELQQADINNIGGEMGEEKTTTFRVVTFNIWLSGAKVENGLEKIAKHIALLKPDIVALQEVETDSVMANLTQLLGPPWSGIFNESKAYPDTAILSPHKFLKDQPVELWAGTGGTVVVEKNGFAAPLVVNFFSMHLNYTSYGPYAAQNRMVTNPEQIMHGEKTADGLGRVSNMQELLANPQFQLFSKQAESENRPLIVAGDFNCPSHEDWIEDNKQEHGGWVFQWPATKMITSVGMIDSFRQIHPNVVETPGHTWSTVQKFAGPEWDYTIPEPQDRLDFIFYKGNSIKPIKSSIYSGSEPLRPIPDQFQNDYPSDHFAVITDFQVSMENRQ